MHTRGMRPQKIRTIANKGKKSRHYLKRHFLPFLLTKLYLNVQPVGYDTNDEQFFIFSDRSSVTAEHARTVLKLSIDRLGLDSSLYSFHSLRIG